MRGSISAPEIERLSTTVFEDAGIQDKDEEGGMPRSHLDDLALKIEEIYADFDGRDRSQRVQDVIDQFEKEEEWFPRWQRSEIGRNPRLSKLLQILPESQRWSLVEKAWKREEGSSYWLEGVSERIQTLVRTHSFNQGIDIFKSRFLEHVKFQKLLANGLGIDQRVNGTSGEQFDKLASWEELAITTHKLLLRSSFAGTVRAALFSLSRYLRYKPALAAEYLSDSELGGWELGWIISAMEPLSRTGSKLPLVVIESLKEHLSHFDFDVRVKAWLVLALSEPGEHRFDCSNLDSEEAPERLADGFETSPMLRGARRFVTDHDAGQTIFRKIRHTTGADLDGLVGLFTAWMISQPKVSPSDVCWPENLRQDQDYYCDRFRSQFALNKVLGKVISESPIPETVIPRFAMAFLQAEEPEFFGQMPKDFSESSHWPKSLLGAKNNDLTHGQIVARHRELATETAYGWTCLAAEIHTYDYNEDRIYRLWSTKISQEMSLESTIPTTLNGRTFSYILEDKWWQPRWKGSSSTLAFFVGGSFMLSWSQLLIFPARCWKDEFGWSVDEQNPLEWRNTDGELVAHYERLHGPLENHSRDETRIPMLHRWVVKTEELQRLGLIDSFRIQEDFQRADFNED